jgi:hypothetical protein
MNLGKRGASWSFGQRGYHVTVGHGHLRQTVGLPGTGLSWTSVSGGGKRQTRQVARRAVRRPPPQSARPPISPAQSRQTAITCLLILFVLGTAGLGLIPIAIWAVVRKRRRRREPDFLARQLIDRARAAPDPATAVGMLHSALDTDPGGANTLLMCADWFYSHQCWADAADAYAGYFHLASSSSDEIKYAVALSGAGHLDEALTELQQLVTRGLTESDHDYVLSQLALVYMLKGDPSQGLAFANQANLRKRDLSAGAQRSLMMRASCRYLLGQKAKAREDLDRLYAINSSSEVLELKNRMAAVSFQLEVPEPYPSWYPASVHALAAPEGEEASADSGAFGNGDLSPDGRWKWSGSEWEAIAPASPPNQALASEVPAQDADQPQTAVHAVSLELPDVTPQEFAAPRSPVFFNSATSVDEGQATSAFPTASPADDGANARPDQPEQGEQNAPVVDNIGLSSPTQPVTLTPSTDSSGIAEGAEPSTTAAGQMPPNTGGDGDDRLSPDGAWWWNGSEWISAFSDDGKWHWNGSEWKLATSDRQ